MQVEEQYYDVLQNIEFAIIATYHEHPDLSDYDVLRALEVLIDNYSGEKIGRPPRSVRLSDLERDLIEAIHHVCEWRLGRAESPIEYEGKETPSPKPLTVDEIILCLKQLVKSVNLWTKEGGRQGYLDYTSQFIK